MKLLARAIRVGGLLAAISGAIDAIRGDWPAMVFCATLVISAGTLTALWAPLRRDQLALTTVAG
jgi:hypothetical protein